MADRPPTGSRIHRLQIGLNVLAQIAAVLAIGGLVNYFAYNHYHRWDWSRNRKTELADQTRRLLKNLDKPLRAIVFFAPTAPVYEDVMALLKEYQYAARKKIDVEIVDPYRNFSRARELQGKYKFGANEDVVILDYGGKSKCVDAKELAEFDESGAMYGEAPLVTAFLGEQVLTGAILELTEDRQQRLGIVVGQGQPGPDDEALATLKAYLVRQNVRVEPLDLAAVHSIPEALGAVFLLGPKYDLSEREIAMLGSYWDRKGRLFVALDPTALTPRLHAFLAAHGVTPRADRVLTAVNLGKVTGIVRDVTGQFVEGSKIAKRFPGVNTMFLGPTQSLALAADKGDDLEVFGLIEASTGYWGETRFDVDIDRGDQILFEPKSDHGAPLVLAATVERGGVKDERVQVASGRMVVVGNAGFVLADALQQVAPNVDLLLAATNWLLDRERLIGIAPKRVERFTLALTQGQTTSIALLTMAAVPFGAAALGVAIWLGRRR